MAQSQQLLLLLPLLLLACSVDSAAGDEADFSDHITCYECEGQLDNSTCSSPGVDIDKTLNQVTCVKGGCIKWAFYRHSSLQVVRTCSLRVNLSIYLQSACRHERRGNGFICICANDLCNRGHGLTAAGTWAVSALVAALLTGRQLLP